MQGLQHLIFNTDRSHRMAYSLLCLANLSAGAGSPANPALDVQPIRGQTLKDTTACSYRWQCNY